MIFPSDFQDELQRGARLLPGAGWHLGGEVWELSWEIGW